MHTVEEGGVTYMWEAVRSLGGPMILAFQTTVLVVDLGEHRLNEEHVVLFLRALHGQK